jgi:DNA helicase II / ATP-dependent DNA helicase PcrA
VKISSFRPKKNANFWSCKNPKTKIEMSHWQKIRDLANDLKREICAANDLDEKELFPAQDFLELTADYLELDLIPEHPDSVNLSKALAVLEDDCVFYNNHLKKWYRAFCIAHEIGHARLHHESVHCTQDEIEIFENEDSAIGKIVGYGAGERREREANLFALELLLPSAALKNAFLEEKLTAREIAEKTGMPEKIVAGQLARALLVPLPEKAVVENQGKTCELDESQRRAAETVKCPMLVAAGPGTGKTQTLTSRIRYLLENGIEPKRILALTFSNRAAEEMRERIARVNEQAAAQMNVMTFHAFGLDILRRYYVEAGLDSHSPLLDKIDALLHLENNLNDLRLVHYEALHEPTSNLPAILGAISRAKDELCSPVEYQALGKAMLARAEENQDEELKTKAEKVLETSRVYEFYQEYLDGEKMLDFGDLIYRAVRLLRENAAVKAEVCAQFDAVLVDEFQDVNRACGYLLKEIAGCGESLWAVGDLRQSIYRWRGASPANINLFGTDFPNAETLSLETNYRSREEIVGLFSHFATGMKAAGTDFFHKWTAQRGTGNVEGKRAIEFDICDDLETEAARIAESVALYHEQGLEFKDCAVICRTHSQLNKIAAVLSRKEIPIFHLGEIFERDEVRDLLALLDLKFSTDGHSLIRVAAFGEYRIPLADARKIISWQTENRLTFAEALADERLTADLSAGGKAGAVSLAKHLSAYPKEISAWGFLSKYIFSESEFLKSLFTSDDVNNQSRRLAIYQFLRFAQSSEARFESEELPIPAFLSYVKKLAVFNEDKNYAQMPAEAENLDAVRLLTVHSAKGLEFPVVFLPYLGAGKFPGGGGRGATCPNPDGMIEGETDFRDEEEECLFFVAMSRARNHLHLSRSKKYGDSTSNESKFLTFLKEFLPEASEIGAVDNTVEEVREESDSRRVFYSAELDRYLECPRKFFYASVLGLKGAGEKSIFLKFHSCVYDTLRSIQTIRQMETIELSEETALKRLDEFWQKENIDAHPYAPIYRQKAEDIIRRMCANVSGTNAERMKPGFEIKLSNGAVRIEADSLEIADNGDEKTAVFRKYRTGKSQKKIDPKNAEVLAALAARENFPDANPVLMRVNLGDDTIQEVRITEQLIKNRVKKYEKVIDDINKRLFEASPKEPGNCPHCAYFFICPSGDLKT